MDLPNDGQHIEYPFMPTEGEIGYVAADDPFLQAAKAYAQTHSLDTTMPTGSVVVINNEIVGGGANGSTYHEEHGCERVRLGIPTGQGYELCEGCSPANHSEPRAIADALKHVEPAQLEAATIYLWGHWWCCQSCWNAMLSAGIHTVLLRQDSDILFNKDNPGNVVGHQLEAA